MTTNDHAASSWVARTHHPPTALHPTHPTPKRRLAELLHERNQTMSKQRLAAQRSPRWAFMERFEVPDYDDPSRNYLTRWRIIQTPWAAIYLHRMDGPDPRATLHDHPWPFVSFVLRGGYDEVQSYTLPLGQPVTHLNHKRPTDLHYIRRLHRTPTWTFLFVGPRRRTWGYVDRDGTWTAFDQHPHNAEFEQAMAQRKATS